MNPAYRKAKRKLLGEVWRTLKYGGNHWWSAGYGDIGESFEPIVRAYEEVCEVQREEQEKMKKEKAEKEAKAPGPLAPFFTSSSNKLR